MVSLIKAFPLIFHEKYLNFVSISVFLLLPYLLFTSELKDIHRGNQLSMFWALNLIENRQLLVQLCLRVDTLHCQISNDQNEHGTICHFHQLLTSTMLSLRWFRNFAKILECLYSILLLSDWLNFIFAWRTVWMCQDLHSESRRRVWKIYSLFSK